MRCFSCITARKRFPYDDARLFHPYSPTSSDSPDGTRKSCSESSEPDRQALCLEDKDIVVNKIISSSARCFSYRELAVATKNFRESHVIGEGGFGKVYKGRLEKGQVVAIKRLNLESLQGNQEFIVEVLMLSLLHHPNLVTLIGYCAEGDQRLLVYEFMSRGSLADHLFDVEHEKDVLDWNTRLRIAAGAARGIEYLHCVAKPPVIYRDMKSANVLLDENFNTKLSDFGLAKLGPVGDKTHISTRVMGTYGYCAPEYASSGKLTQKSDIYCFGVMLLELITGCKALDFTKRSVNEQSLVMREMKNPKPCIQTQLSLFTHHMWIGGFLIVGAAAHAAIFMVRDYDPTTRYNDLLDRVLRHRDAIISHLNWSRNCLKNPKKHLELVDPRLRGRFPARSARHLIAVTAMCLNDEANPRPSATEIVNALDYLLHESQKTSSTTAGRPPTGSTSTSSPLFSQQGTDHSKAT